MTQKERLIELIIQSVDGCARHWAEIIADYLLSNGVIVPPCKVGDTAYLIGWFDATVKEEKILYLTYDSRLNNLVFETAMCLFDANQIGKFVFLNREAAEKALKERETQ